MTFVEAVDLRKTVTKILEEGHVKSRRTPRRACMKRLMAVDEAKEVCRDRRVWRSVKCEVKLLNV